MQIETFYKYSSLIKNKIFKVIKTDNMSNVNFKTKIIYLLVCLLAVFFVFLSFITVSSYMQLPFVRYLSIWAGVALAFYWVLSALWCLYDKDDYGRNVSSSDDFYNVAFTSFWLTEGFLLSLFLAYARMFDFYDPFLESDEIEHYLINEDVDSGCLKHLVLCFITTIIISSTVDVLLNFESLNYMFFSVFIFAIFLITLLVFLKTSVKFVEEMDFEEDGDYLYDETDSLFEHEDFPEEGFDGGDYAEGYEILQLFFGYWHYTFIVIHLSYLIYAVFASNGRQQHTYWATAAISQNIVLIVILDYLDWGEVFTTYDFVTFEGIYNWFYSSEDVVGSIQTLTSEIFQIFEFFLYFNDLFDTLNPAKKSLEYIDNAYFMNNFIKNI